MMFRLCLLLLLAGLIAAAHGAEIQPSRLAEAKTATAKEMSLADAVFLGLRTNRNVRSAYLARSVDKFDLRVAEDEFRPDVTLNASGRLAQSSIDDGTTTDTRVRSDDVAVEVSQKITTGAVFSFRWADQSTDSTRDNPYSEDAGAWAVTVEQPLLRGGGIDVATAARSQARIRERNSVLGLRSTVESIVDSIITSYRDYYLAVQQIQIAADSLQRARDQYEINQVLIAAKRMAEVELVQTEADIAAREFAYEAALNAADRARLSLLTVLDIDKRTPIQPVAEQEPPQVDLQLERLLAIAYANRTDYLESLNRLESARIEVQLARNNRKWDLSVSGGYDSNDVTTSPGGNADERGWNVGARLSIPLYGDLSREQYSLDAEAALEQAQLAHADLKDAIELSVINGAREVDSAHKQLVLARRSTGLTRKKLEIEQEKLRTGRSSNFELVSFQNDLVSAQNSELASVIGYLNALTALDALLGTTLDTWKIALVGDEYRSKE